MATRREFIRDSAVLAGAAAMGGRFSRRLARCRAAGQEPGCRGRCGRHAGRGEVQSGSRRRAYEAGLKELTGEKSAAGAWFVALLAGRCRGVKINCIGAPKVSTSLESVRAVIDGLKSAE